MNIDELESLLEQSSQGGWCHASRMIENTDDDAPDIATFNPSLFGQDEGDCKEECANAHLASLAPALAVSFIDSKQEIAILKQEINTLTSDNNVLRSGFVIPDLGFMRLPQVLKFFPVGKTSWYNGVASGKYPKPVKLSERTSAWRCEDISNLIKTI